MVLPIIFGAAQAGASILGAFGAQNQANAAVDARNASLLSDYKARLKIREANWVRELGRYNLQKQAYADDLFENNLSASKAYASEQRRLNEIFKQAAFQTQDRNIQQAQALGTAAASGRSGKSAARLQAMTAAAFGRNAAIQQQSLQSARESYGIRTDRIRDQLRIANRNAYRNVQFAPVPGAAPIAPTFQDQPSQIPLFTGIGKGLLGGLQAGYQMDNLING